MFSEGLGIILKPDITVFCLAPQGTFPMMLHMDGYLTRMHGLMEMCLEDRIPLFLGDDLPLTESTCRLLEKFKTRDIRLWANRRFRSCIKSLFPDTELALNPVHAPPTGSFPLTIFTLIRDPIWQVFQDLAIPLPRRVVFAVEDPLDHLFLERERLAESFSHFLDTGGRSSDLIHRRSCPPRGGLALRLTAIFPNGIFVDPPTAALLGIFLSESDRAVSHGSRWIMVHAESEVTTVFAIKDDRIQAGLKHQTHCLTPDTLNEYLVQMISGRRFEKELLMDGGLFAQTRLLPEEEGPWCPVFLTGSRAKDFSSLPGVLGESNQEFEKNGLLSLLKHHSNK